jgi:hypothetical protein
VKQQAALEALRRGMQLNDDFILDALSQLQPTMSPDPSPDPLDRLAAKRASMKLGFYIHAAVYLAVNLGLALPSGGPREQMVARERRILEGRSQ